MRSFRFENRYTSLPERLFTTQNPVPVKNPETVIYNYKLAEELGIELEDIQDYLSGNKLFPDSHPIAQAYSGHQFGHLSILGDGRAILLGEHITDDSKRFDIQLKGSGRTPYSRSGDGRATLYSMLREYIISHAMENLGIKTTKSLAVIKTGEDVMREEVHEGAILTRVASSHIRVGTFQYAAMTGDLNILKTFTDYVIARHYPLLVGRQDKYTELLSDLMDIQIELIVSWLRVGFIHGVMNTDNMTISGETIDYGPCAFMDTYNPNTVFSSIDRYGRYSFENQSSIGGWNLARFAETLIPLIDDDNKVAFDRVNGILEQYKGRMNSAWLKMMASKIGIKEPSEANKELIYELLSWMEKNRSDYIKTFRTLSNPNFLDLIEGSDDLLENWYKRWSKLNPDKGLMEKSNPAIIPRNHIVESVLKDACNHNMEPLNNFLKELEDPYKDKNENYYTTPPANLDSCYQTFCGT